jgi:hypothetical protein
MMRLSRRKFYSSLIAMGLVTSALMPVPTEAEAAVTVAPTLHVKHNAEVSATRSLHRNDRLFVPAVFFRQLGVTVEWLADSQSVSLRIDDRRLVLPAGEADVIHRTEGTYVPIRYASESLGFTVGFDARSGEVSIHSRNHAAMSNTSLYWLKQITEAEAGGESYEGKVAVAAVILNRVASPDWPNTIHEVIFQVVDVNGTSYYQFSPVLDKRIYEVQSSTDTARAVKDAMAGKDPTNGATVFYNPAKTDNRWVRERPVSVTIGNHVFAE